MFGFIKKLGINITHIECKAEYLAHSKPLSKWQIKNMDIITEHQIALESRC